MERAAVQSDGTGIGARIQEDIDWFVEKYDYRNKDADWKNSKVCGDKNYAENYRRLIRQIRYIKQK